MKNAWKFSILLGTLMLAAGVLAQSSNAVSDNHPPADRPTTGSTGGGTQSATDYVIGADDVLHISVWKEPDLSETLPVRPDGKISMPLLGDVDAGGMTPADLGKSITEKLRKYISDPRVTVVVNAMNSQRVFVTGEVNKPGTIGLLPHMTVLQALADAGFTQFANLKAIYVLRNENGRQVKHPFNYKEVVKGNHPEQNIPLKPGDTIVVP